MNADPPPDTSLGSVNGDRGASILIVDDEPEMCRILQGFLEDEGYLTQVAANGDEAVAMYEELRPDAVLLDMYMPKMDGLATLAALRKIDCHARIVMLTGGGKQAVVRDAIMGGARDFILKPFDLDQILNVMEGVLAA